MSFALDTIYLVSLVSTHMHVINEIYRVLTISRSFNIFSFYESSIQPHYASNINDSYACRISILFMLLNAFKFDILML